MNYKESIKTITPDTNDSPYLLKNLRSHLANATEHEIPFFLMPVRLETRFMEVEVNLLAETDNYPQAIKKSLEKVKTFNEELQGLKNFRAFESVDIGAVLDEVESGVQNVNSTLDNAFLTNLSKNTLSYTQHLLEEVEASLEEVRLAIETPLGNVRSSLGTSLGDLTNIIKKKQDNITDLIKHGKYNEEWKSEVDEQAAHLIKDWERIFSQMTGVIQEGDVLEQTDKYLDTVNSMVGDIGSKTSMSWQNKEHLLERLQPLLEKIATILQDRLKKQQEKDPYLIYKLYKTLQNSIKALFSGNFNAEPERIAYLNQPLGVTSRPLPEAKLVTTEVQEASLEIQIQKEDLKVALYELNSTKEGGNTGELNGRILSSLENISDVLTKVNASDKKEDFDYLFNALKGIDFAINTYAAKATKETNIAYSSTVAKKADYLGYLIGNEFNRISGIALDKVKWISSIQKFKCLWIRVYPDDIAVNGHEKRLTAVEQNSGRDYWNAWAASYGDPAKQLKAWQILANTYGPERAAWIVKATTPTNLTDLINNFSLYFQAHPQLKDLNQYTLQLNKLSQSESSKIILSAPHWDVFVPTAKSIKGRLEQVDELPSEEFNKLVASYLELDENFNTLADNARHIAPEGESKLPPGGDDGQPASDAPGEGQSGEGEPHQDPPMATAKPFKLEESLSEIRYHINEIGDRLNYINWVGHWTRWVVPEYADISDLRQENEVQASFSNVLPDRFLFATVNKWRYDPNSPFALQNPDPVKDPGFGSYSFKHIKIGNAIPENLKIGIDPLNGIYDRTALDQLQVDPQVKWMFDFKEAVQKGMAVEIPLSAGEFTEGFDVVLTLGLKLGEVNNITNPEGLIDLGKTLLEDLLENHHYSPGGLSVLEIGSPTNNTEEGDAPFDALDKDFSASFALETGSPLFNYTNSRDPLEKKDGQLLADALGIDHAVFQHVGNAGGAQIAASIAMNRALFNGTIGNYMGDIMKFLFTEKNVSHTKAYFTDYVLGRGMLPSIRVGKQPYGILPVSTLGRWEWKRTFYGTLDGKQVGAQNEVIQSEESYDWRFYSKDPGDHRTYMSDVEISTAFGTLLDPVPQPTEVPEQNKDLVLRSYLTGEYELLMGAEESEKYFQDRFQIRRDFVFETLNRTWENIANWHVKTVDKKSALPQEDFLRILGLEATTAEFYSRIFINNKTFRYSESGEFLDSKAKDATDPSNPPGTSGFSDPIAGKGADFPAKFKDLFLSARPDMSGYPVFYGPSSSDRLRAGHPGGQVLEAELSVGIMDTTAFMEKLPSNGIQDVIKYDLLSESLNAFNISFISDAFNLYGPSVVEDEDNKVTLPLYQGGNYIQWLRSASLEAIWANNQFNVMTSRSLLFLLLRQSVLTTYRDVASKILEKADAMRKSSLQLIGSPEGVTVQKDAVGLDDGAILTKWDILFSTLERLNVPNSAYEYFEHYPEGVNHLNKPALPFNFNSPPNLIVDLKQYGFTNMYGTYRLAPYLHRHLINSPLNTSPTWREVKLSEYLKGTSSNTTFNNHLDKITDWSPIKKLDTALTLLSTCSVAELDRLTKEHISLCSYRLDAWNLGKVNKRLWEQRRTDQSLEEGPRKTGIYLGAYGWVMDIRPKGSTGICSVSTQHLPSKLTNTSGTVYFDPESAGFIQTPSMAHALTAALLRAGYNSEKHITDSRLAINLTSDRVAVALRLLAGMQNGQTLNALIGYEFERGLHETSATGALGQDLNALIYDLRRTYAVIDPVTFQGNIQSSASIKADSVVDGLALIGSIKYYFADIRSQNPGKSIYELYVLYGGSSWFDSSYNLLASGTGANLPGINTPLIELFLKEIDKVIDYVDALGDLAVAEGVFQIAKGNIEKGGAVLEAWGKGTNPPDPEIVKTPKSGLHLTHRLAIALSPVSFVPPPASAQNNPWPSIPLSIRSQVEPTINNWVAGVLDDYMANLSLNTSIPATISSATTCKVSYTPPLGQPTVYYLKLQELKIQPIDLLQMINREGFSDELDARIRYEIRKSHNLLASTTISIDYTEKDADSISFSDLFPILNAIQGILGEARALETDDFMAATPYPLDSAYANQEFNIPELDARAQYAWSELNDLITDMQAIPSFTSSNLEDGRDSLKKASFFDMPFAVPATAQETTTDTFVIDDLWRIFVSVREALLEKKAKAQVLHNQTQGMSISTDEKVHRDKLVKLIQAILGEKFLVVTQFKFRKYQGLQTDINKQLIPTSAANDLLIHHASVEEVVDDWVYGLARVNKTASHMETLRLLGGYQPATNPSLSLMRPVQFPFQDGGNASAPVDYWLGADYPTSYSPEEDKLSVAVFDYQNLDTTSADPYNCGLIVGSWEEVLPFKEITTGVTFNYDQPSAKPPQSILLAVNPQVIQERDPANTEKQWRLEDLLHTLLDTIDLAKMRMVEPDCFRAADVGKDINPYMGIETVAGSQDKEHTDMFELFKSILPAIVGEMTPIVKDKYAGGTDSVQQVSFDYNPNNDVPPPGKGSQIDPAKLEAIRNAEFLSAKEVFRNRDVRDFLQEQDALSGLAATQQKLNKQL